MSRVRLAGVGVGELGDDTASPGARVQHREAEDGVGAGEQLSVGARNTLLIDMDPQAQVTQWLGAGDGLSTEGTLTAAMEGRQSLDSVVQPTRFPNLSFVPSSQGLEDLGRQITETEGYPTILTRLLASLSKLADFVVIDSPTRSRR